MIPSKTVMWSFDMYNPMDLTGKRILVTGASSGIGRACAVVLAKLGATIIAVARNGERLDETIALLHKGKHVKVTADLSALDSIGTVFELACANGEKLYGLVHAAGIGPAIPIQAMSARAMQEVMTINFFAFMELTKQFIKKKYTTGGSIIGISSVSGSVGWQGYSLYGASKGALDSAVRSLAIELHLKGFRVNSVVPSNIRTQMYAALEQINNEETEARILANQPLGIGEPDDVAHAVAFLLSDAAKFITGTNLVVDGGYLAQ
jgi:NAD(P)-dependent dehydrogenase (short-subunit alcohol dehydrogenase family)